MRVRFLGFGHTDSYRSAMPGCESPWPAREVRDVPDSTAEYLTETFPGAFKKEGGRPRKVAVSAPPLDRSIKSPEARPLAAPSHEDALKGSVGAVKAALASGAYDEALDALEASERAGKARKGVFTAIKQRRVAVEG